jgi:hypothetical protein
MMTARRRGIGECGPISQYRLSFHTWVDVLLIAAVPIQARGCVL